MHEHARIWRCVHNCACQFLPDGVTYVVVVVDWMSVLRYAMCAVSRI